MYKATSSPSAFGTALLLLVLSRLATALPASSQVSVTTERSFKAPLLKRSRSSTSLALHDHKWQTEVTIGGQSLKLEVDTGSYDLWVYGPEVANQGSSQNLYDASKSSTSRRVDGAFFLESYSGGVFGAYGEIVMDTVAIGQASVQSMAVRVATEVGTGNWADGILGLGFSKDVIPRKYPGFMEVLQSSLDQPLFTVDCNTAGSPSIEFGAIDSSKYSGELTTVPSDPSNKAWAVNDITFSVNGVAIGYTQPVMMVDTGGNRLMRVNGRVAEAYWNQVPGSWDNSGQGTEWTLPCDTTPPDLVLHIGSGTAVIPGHLLNTGIVNGPKCTGALIAVPDSEWANLAAPFFLSHFVVFNQAARTVSFAPFS